MSLFILKSPYQALLVFLVVSLIVFRVVRCPKESPHEN